MIDQRQNQPMDSGASKIRRSDWLPDSIVSGFVATIMMSIVMAAAYGLARWIGDEGGSRIEKWFWALAHNPVIDSTQDAIAVALAANLVMGLVWAVAYGFDAEPRLSGSGWRKGMLFALGPWLLSIVAFFPIMDGGLFGRDIHAGPLPIVGSLILHLVYGAVLGSVYAIDLGAWLDETECDLQNADAQQRGAALGALGGLVVGTVGGWLIGPSLSDVADRGFITLAGALVIGGLGVAVGSLYGSEVLERSRHDGMRTTR
jgi:hypothetical protein